MWIAVLLESVTRSILYKYIVVHEFCFSSSSSCVFVRKDFFSDWIFTFIQFNGLERFPFTYYWNYFGIWEINFFIISLTLVRMLVLKIRLSGSLKFIHLIRLGFLFFSLYLLYYVPLMNRQRTVLRLLLKDIPPLSADTEYNPHKKSSFNWYNTESV